MGEGGGGDGGGFMSAGLDVCVPRRRQAKRLFRTAFYFNATDRDAAHTRPL